MALELPVRSLLGMSMLMMLGSVVVTGWLAVVGYRAYQRRGTRLLRLATAGLALIAVSRGLWLLTGYQFVSVEQLAVEVVLVVQILRSATLVAGFGLVVYAIYTTG